MKPAMKIILKPNNRPTKPGAYVVRRVPWREAVLCEIEYVANTHLWVRGDGVGCIPLSDIEKSALWSDVLEIEVEKGKEWKQ